MLFEVILGTMIGLCIGAVTGIIPGIHVNLASLIFITLIARQPGISPLFSGCAIVAMMVAHTTFDLVPAIFLGAPDEQSALSVLPGHRLLLEGRGLDAIFYSLLGQLLGLAFLLAISFPLFLLLPVLLGLTKQFIGWILLGFVILMILRERDSYRRGMALIVVLLAGSLGMITFSMGLEDPLLPLLSGLFGVSLLIGNMSENAKIPPQVFEIVPQKTASFTLACALGASIGSLLNLFPGVGPSQASIIALNSVPNKRKEIVLATIGAVGMGSLLGSIVAVASIGKARNAPIVFVQEHLGDSLWVMAVMLCVAALALCLSSFLVLRMTPRFVRLLAKIPYKGLSISLMLFTILMVILLAGLLGLFVFAVSVMLGLAAQSCGIGKHHLMAALLLPTIGYFLL